MYLERAEIAKDILMLMIRKNNLFFAFMKFSIYLLDHLIFYQS